MANLRGLVAQFHPVRRGKVHRLRHAVTAAHFGDEGTGVADHELAAPLHRAVNLDAFAAQHLWRDLQRGWESQGVRKEILHTDHFFEGGKKKLH